MKRKYISPSIEIIIDVETDLMSASANVTGGDMVQGCSCECDACKAGNHHYDGACDATKDPNGDIFDPFG